MCKCCSYDKIPSDDDDNCCNCCCCNCICSTFRKLCCCCCRCGMCIFKIICSILSCAGIFLVIYLIMMICTDEYLRGAVWRDRPFYYRYDSDLDFVDDHGEAGSDGVKCEDNVCDGIIHLYMYATGGTGFLGATLFDMENEGVIARVNDVEKEVKLELYGTTNLSEAKGNRIAFKYHVEFTETDLGDIKDFELDINNLKFTSIAAGFWDFMPMGPGSSFGIADSNEFYPCPNKYEEDINIEYICQPME